jgi:hypothetical protein
MVISMDDRMIYQLDSHLRKEVIEERRSTIRNIVCVPLFNVLRLDKSIWFYACKSNHKLLSICSPIDQATTLAKIVEVVYEGFISFTLLADFQYWDIVPAMGIPNCGNRYSGCLLLIHRIQPTLIFP